jgi:hypothetical protein
LTICITTFNPDQIIFASDQLAYQWKDNLLDLFFDEKMTFDHTNIKGCIEKVLVNKYPKILKIGSHTAIIRGGDVRLNHVTDGLDTTTSIVEQIISRLKQTNIKPSIWACEVGSFTDSCSVHSITYHNRTIQKQHNIIGQSINTLSQEIVDIFHKQFATDLWFAETNAKKIHVLNQFFKEISDLYNGLAGGIPIIALINREGFKWLQC